MPKMRLSLDSGAYSVFNKIIRKKGQALFSNIDYSFVNEPEFRTYLDHYGEYVKELGHIFDFYVNLDVIYNPELSYEMWLYLRKNFGVNPLPVFHFGEDIKWLKKYMDETDYIGLSGVAGGLNKSKYRQHTDRVFKYLSDSRGTPRFKTHGFGLTAMELVQRYPWYTCDSSTWVKMSLCGIVLIPRLRQGKPCYSTGWQMYTVSERSKYTDKASYFGNLPPNEQRHLLDYIEARGVALGKSTYELVTKPKDYTLTGDDKWMGKALADGSRWVEHREELGIVNDHQCRDKINLMIMLDLQDDLKPWPWSFTPAKPTLWDRMKKETYDPGTSVVPRGTDRTTIHLGGNFDLLLSKGKEKDMRDFVFSTGHDYVRMVSFFFHEMYPGEQSRMRNIIPLWHETLEEQQEPVVQSKLTPSGSRPSPAAAGGKKTSPQCGCNKPTRPLRRRTD